MISLLKLLIRSIQLDVEFIKTDLSLIKKAEFVLKKYLLLFRNFIFGFKKGKSKVNIFKHDYYFEDRFGIAFLQSVYVDNSFLSRFIKKNAVIIDIGANIGQFNLFCRDYLKAKRVYSFEPVPTSFELLKSNCKDDVYNYAVSVEKNITLYIPETSLMASSYKTDTTTRELKVNAVNLDEFDPIKNEKEIDLLKIDTEGSELDVLKACRNQIKKSGLILIEASINRDSAGSLTELVCFLCSVSPKLRVVEIGRPYKNNDRLEAIDILFSNTQ